MKDETKYQISLTPLDCLIENNENPRKISERNFNRLVKSIKDAPWMLKLRPIVVNEKNIILGGNQRFKACIEAGLDKTWVIKVNDLNNEQQKRFILRDNIDFGKWDLDIIRKNYSQQELLDYGSEITLMEKENPVADETIRPPPALGTDDEVEPNIDENELEESNKNFNNNTIKQIIFQLSNDLYEDTLKTLDIVSLELDLDDNSEVLLHLIHFYEVGNGITEA